MIRAPRNLPKPETRLVQPDGRMTREWYDYFRELDQAMRDLIKSDADHETRIAALEP